MPACSIAAGRSAKRSTIARKRGGTVVLVGMSANPVFEYDFGTLQNKEAAIYTVFRYRNLYPAAIDAVSRCGIPLKEIVTDYYSFSDIPRALEDSVERKSEMVKAVIHVSD